MGPLSSRLYPEALRSIDSSTLSGSYVALGGPFLHPIRLIKFTNNSTVSVTVSWDGGITDHEILVSGGFLLMDVATNKETSQPFDIAEHTQMSIKGSAGTGLVYLSAYYGA